MIKYLILLLTILALGSIIYGFSVETAYSQKFIGFGTLGLFIIVFPLFSWYRWKDKNVQDYMLTKENLDKMRENQKRGKL
jgi:hypothetical protein